MIKINAAVRNAARAALARSNQYDAATMRIARNGVVQARKDANKTLAGYNPAYYDVGAVETIVNQDGSICKGW